MNTNKQEATQEATQETIEKLISPLTDWVNEDERHRLLFGIVVDLKAGVGNSLVYGNPIKIVGALVDTANEHQSFLHLLTATVVRLLGDQLLEEAKEEAKEAEESKDN